MMSVPSVLMSCRPIVDGLHRDLGLSIDTIAPALNVDRRTVERWRADHRGRYDLRESFHLLEQMPVECAAARFVGG